MDFSISPELEALRARIATFVADHILPLESDPSAYDGHGNIAAGVLEPLRDRAKQEGLWCLQLPRPDGAFIGYVGMVVC